MRAPSKHMILKRGFACAARPLAGCFACSLAALLLASPTLAQQSLTSEASQRLKAGQERLADTTRREQVLRADVSQMDEQRSKLNAQLQETARLVQRSEAQMSQIEDRRDELDTQRKLLEGSLEQSQASI